ncbi:hypothetical protein Q9Q94_10200 [Uliginosibacterium sp. 31-16]|uniref:hypothetical protein n=1 Tax=Uliginosibacterium sp. 31-16 TaxID=3068315 RepID=UPI00273DA418|nr:hypothetical protein [Uliginosibacterium sp. 31-16]MDP5239906.1 hypothetical protein [Uliginosibacterium sp. 31-16]
MTRQKKKQGNSSIPPLNPPPPGHNDETIKWLLDHAASAYEAELANTEKLRARISFVFTVAVTPSLAAAGYLMTSLRGSAFSEWNLLLFWAPLAIAIIGVGIAARDLSYILLTDFRYSRIPAPSAIWDFFKNYQNDEEALKEAQLGLLTEYTESFDHNFKQNEHRKSKLLRAQRYAFTSFVVVFLCIPKWLYNYTQVDVKPQTIKIVANEDTSNGHHTQNHATCATNDQSGKASTTCSAVCKTCLSEEHDGL